MSKELPIRDIHLPDSVPWWPIAPGWWLLFLLGLFFVLLVYQKRIRQRRLQHRKLNQKTQLYQAQQLLEKLNKNTDNKQLIKEISVLLRRTAMSLYGREEIAGLTGKAWLQFLDDKGETNVFSEGAGRVLIDQPYKKITRYERDELITITQQWLTAQAQDGRGQSTRHSRERGSPHV